MHQKLLQAQNSLRSMTQRQAQLSNLKSEFENMFKAVDESLAAIKAPKPYDNGCKALEGRLEINYSCLDFDSSC